jgi:uncharacterized protein (TIGR00251 family)
MFARANSVIYDVEVKFHKDFIEVNENRILVGLTSKPERGEANRDLIKKLAKHFKVSTSQVRIVSGLKSKNKVVEILHASV